MLKAVLSLTGLLCVEACDAPKTTPVERRVNYRVVTEWVIPNGGTGKVILIDSISANDRDLRILGNELRADTHQDWNAFIDVFSDERAALLRQAVTTGHANKADLKFYDAHYVGIYTHNGNTGTHTFEIMAAGLHGPAIKVRY